MSDEPKKKEEGHSSPPNPSAQPKSIYGPADFPGNPEGNRKAMMASSIQGSTFHEHTNQNFILITSDKLHLKVIDYKKRLEASIGWQTPLALVVTVFLAFITTDFKKTWGVPAGTWEALFILAGVIFAFWTVRSGISALRNNGQLDPEQFVEDILEEIRQDGSDVR